MNDAEKTIEQLIQEMNELRRRITSSEAAATGHRSADDEVLRLASIVESSDDAIIGKTLDGIITSWNLGAEKLYDYAAAEVKGQPISILASPNRADEVSGLLEKIRRGEHVHHYETERLKKDGGTISVSLTISPIKDTAGRLVSAATIARDITERKRAEEALRESRENLEALLEARDVTERKRAVEALQNERQRLSAVLERIPAYVVLQAPDYTIPYANREFVRRFGEPGRRRCYEFLFGRDAPCENCQTQAVFQTGTPAVWELVGPDGNTYQIYDYPFFDVDGSSLVLEMGVDITEFKRAQEALARQAQELSRSNAELETFAYVASHDLQEPLRMVASYLALLKRRYQGRLDRDADEFIDFAVDGAHRMQILINDLLAYSRVGTRGKAFQATDCEAIQAQVLTNLEVVIRENGAVITSEALPTVRADETQLAQLFQNLLANAIKFRSPEPPRIHFGVQGNEGEWLFSVTDNGIGIAPQFRERIFTIFQRLHDRGEYSGTGIGLAICKKIVERHGGRIWVESEPGQGATFYFTLKARG